MNGLTTHGAAKYQPPRYPLQRIVYDRQEVYAFGLWFSTVVSFETFLHEVERAGRQRRAAHSDASEHQPLPRRAAGAE